MNRHGDEILIGFQGHTVQVFLQDNLDGFIAVVPVKISPLAGSIQAFIANPGSVV